jgi:hypothetical protein
MARSWETTFSPDIGATVVAGIGSLRRMSRNGFWLAFAGGPDTFALEFGASTELPKPAITTAAFSAAVLTGKFVVLGRLLGLLEGAGLACPPGFG